MRTLEKRACKYFYRDLHFSLSSHRYYLRFNVIDRIHIFQQAQSCTFSLTRFSLSRCSRRAKRWYLPTVIFHWNPLFFARREVGGAALKLSGAN